MAPCGQEISLFGFYPTLLAIGVNEESDFRFDTHARNFTATKEELEASSGVTIPPNANAGSRSSAIASFYY